MGRSIFEQVIIYISHFIVLLDSSYTKLVIFCHFLAILPPEDKVEDFLIKLSDFHEKFILKYNAT